ncbi:MAG: Rpp14/Pop5 family protein [Candidatus Woesearchaeota archaeon]
MKPLKPTLREKNRYVFCISMNKEFKKEIHEKYKELYGKVNYSLAGIKILEFFEEKDKIKCIIKIKREHLKELLGCFIFLNTRALIVSGTLKSLKEKINKL